MQTHSSHAHAVSSSDEEIVTISSVVGEGENARRLVRVGSLYELTQWCTCPDGQARVRDVDLAERLDFAQPRAIRKLIKRYVESGDLPAIHWRDTVSRQSTGNGGTREFQVNEYWLTQEEAAFVIAKSETPTANAVLKAMIRVFFLAMRALSERASAPAFSLEDIRALIRSEMADAQPARAIENNGTIGKARARLHILGPLMAYARAKAGLEGDPSRVSKWRQRADNRLRRACDYPSGPGQSWQHLPEGKLGACSAELALLLAENEEQLRDRRADERKAQAQLGLFKTALSNDPTLSRGHRAN